MRPITDDMQDEIDELRRQNFVFRQHWRMTYAGLAMQVMIPFEVEAGETITVDTVVETATEYADALIAALQETKG